MPKLAHSVGRSVLVAIPAFFGDEEPRSCILVDLESSGVWLRGDAVNDRLAALAEVSPPANVLADVFLPYEQIVYLFDPAQFAYAARAMGVRQAPASRAAPVPVSAPKDNTSEHKTSKHKISKHKNSKRTR
jgi:hypothetical protein